MPQDPLPMALGQPHAHLRLSGRVRRGARVKQRAAVPNTVRHPDQRAHGAALSTQVAQLRALHARRVPVLGVDPALVVVAMFGIPPDERALRAANLHILEWFDDRVVLAAPGDSELRAFAARVEAYARGPRPTPARADRTDPAVQDNDDGEADGEDRDVEDAREPTAPYQGLLDRIDRVRAFGPEDVPTPALSAAAAAADPSQPLRVDVHCWCPDDAAEARALHESAVAAVKTAGGAVVDQTLRHAAGLALIRADVPPSAVASLAATRLVRRLDVLPRPDLAVAEVLRATARSLPVVLPPPEGAPAVAVVDSGIRSAHPLLAPAVTAVLAEGVPDAHDDNGHGTFVASLALHGSLEPLLEQAAPITPAGRLISVRILDDRAQFPEGALWEETLLAALEAAADAGAAVVNLSLGDERSPYASERPTPLGAAIDEFARRRDVVVVISAGNYRPEQYPAVTDLPTSFARLLRADPAAGLLDPASSALSLTVGALAADDAQGARRPREDLDRMPMSGQGMPSPVTRRGPGPRRMIKPDLAAPGGSYDHDTLTGRAVRAPYREVVGAAAAPADRLLETRAGTSVAAPLVAHAALTAIAANPGLTANAAKALVLLSATPHENWFGDGMTAGQKRDATQALGGYGRPDAARAARSTDHRAVLLAENRLPPDGVHLYRMELPSSFFEPGGWRRLSLALVYDPPVRPTRLEYLASNMHVNIYRGLTVEQAAAAYILDDAATDPNHGRATTADASGCGAPQLPGEPAGGLAGRGQLPDDADDDSEAQADDGPDGPRVRPGPASIRPALLTGLHPSERTRSRGANQYATRLFRHALKPEHGLDLVVAVQGKQNWPTADPDQRYALALAFERDDAHAQVYADLRASVQLEARLEADAVLEVELGS